MHKLSLSELLDYYVRAVKEESSNETFANQTRKYALALEKQERTALDIWATVREKTINHLGTVWNQFGISYDVIQVSNPNSLINPAHIRFVQNLKSCIKIFEGGVRICDCKRSHRRDNEDS